MFGFSIGMLYGVLSWYYTSKATNKKLTKSGAPTTTPRMMLATLLGFVFIYGCLGAVIYAVGNLLWA